MLDASTLAAQAGSSAYWLDKLGRELDSRTATYQTLQDYYDGRHPQPLASQQFRVEFADRLRGFNDNFCPLVVQALEERLVVQGFGIDGKAGDEAAWRIWQDNQMDAQSQKAHREAILKGECSVIVWYDSAEGLPGDSALIRVQKPEEVIVAYDPEDRLKRLVALKRWKASDGSTRANLYYPDRIEKYVRSRSLRYANQYGRDYIEGGWVTYQDPGDPGWPLPHDLGAVPVVPLLNDPDIDNTGTSEIVSILPLQDMLNKLFVDMMVTSHFTAFRQKWATGLEIPVDPETNKPLDTFRAATDKLWQARDPEVKFGDFAQGNPQQFQPAIETAIQHIASKTRTPAHYLLGQMGSFPSGESLKATETGLTAKARRRTRDFGEAWEEVIRLAFLAAGMKQYGSISDTSTDWKDVETRSEAEHTDALLKQRALNVPDEMLWRQLGYTQQEIAEMKAMNAARPELEPKIVAVGTLAAEPPEPPTGPDVTGPVVE